MTTKAIQASPKSKDTDARMTLNTQTDLDIPQRAIIHFCSVFMKTNTISRVNA